MVSETPEYHEQRAKQVYADLMASILESRKWAIENRTAVWMAPQFQGLTAAQQAHAKAILARRKRP